MLNMNLALIGLAVSERGHIVLVRIPSPFVSAKLLSAAIFFEPVGGF